ANSMIGPCNLIQVLQPVLIQKRTTTSLLRIRVKHHQIKVITLTRHHRHQPSEHVVHVLRRRRMQRQHQKRATLSPTPVTQRRPATSRRDSGILHRRQPQSLRLFLQNEPVAVLIQEQLNSLIKWPTSRHNRSHRYSAHPTRRRHKIRCHSLSHKHISYKVEIAPTARLRRTFRSYASIKSSSSRIYTGALNTMRAPAPFFAISI